MLVLPISCLLAGAAPPVAVPPPTPPAATADAKNEGAAKPESGGKAAPVAPGTPAATASLEAMPPPDIGGPASTPPPKTAVARGTLTLAGAGRRVEVVDASGAVVATVDVRVGEPTGLPLPVGDYQVRDAGDQARIGNVVVTAEGATLDVGEGRDVPPPVAVVAHDPEPQPGAPAVTELANPFGAGGSSRRHPHKARWKRVVSPLAAIFVPGTGHMIAGEGRRGAGILVGAGALGGIAIGLSGSSEQRDTGDPFPPRDALTSKVALSGAGTALGLLWVGQIFDAYATAAGVDVVGRKEHKVELSVQRSVAVSFVPSPDGHGVLSDFTVGLMGQVAPRLSVGLTDLGVHVSNRYDRVSLQGGLRLTGWMRQGDRVWLGGSVGALAQTSAGTRRAVDSLGPSNEVAETPDDAGSVTPYLQLDGRIFVLPRVGLMVTPRVGIPLGTRFTDRDGQIPRYATTFELVTGLAIYL